MLNLEEIAATLNILGKRKQPENSNIDPRLDYIVQTFKPIITKKYSPNIRRCTQISSADDSTTLPKSIGKPARMKAKLGKLCHSRTSKCIKLDSKSTLESVKVH